MHFFGIIRFSVYLLAFALFPSWIYAILFCLLSELIYPYIVAKIYDVEVMPAMDYMTTLSYKEAPANICSITYLKGDADTDWMQKSLNYLMPLMKHHKKLRSRIVQIAGDLYY